MLLTVLVPSDPLSAAPEKPVALVLVDGLTWSEVEDEPALRRTFESGAVANLSTAQGQTPEDPRFGYLFIGAGARVDTAVLPEKLPRDREKLSGAFSGPASTIRPGALGETLSRAGIRAAAVGKDAELVIMDEEGKTPRTYDTGGPTSGLKSALADGAGFVAVDAAGPEEAGRVSKAARKAGAVVAIASPNAPAGTGDLTPFVLDGPEGVLYSPTTRTETLISDADVAPTLLSHLGVESPEGMQGRSATVRPGTQEATKRLGNRLAFVADERFEVWIAAGGVSVLALVVSGYRRGRTELYATILGVASLPAGALLAAGIPVTNVPAVAVLTILFAAALAGISWTLSGRFDGAFAGVCLATAALIAADAAAGGALMKLSTLGYNPAYGARFYGIGNEYSAILAGSLTIGLGALAGRIRLPATLVLALGMGIVVVLGLPTMGADVGGSLALGLGIGATASLLRRGGVRGMVFWAGGGFLVAVVLFALSGIFFPDVSHGSRAASGGGGLVEITVRKLILSAAHLLNPILILLLIFGLILVYAGWRRIRGTAFAAGLLGATITALASGALNDSGILATLFALAYPTIAALGLLLIKEPPELRLQGNPPTL